jgi:hypothetical protein
MRSGMSFGTALERPRNGNSVKIADRESLNALSIRIGIK